MSPNRVPRGPGSAPAVLGMLLPLMAIALPAAAQIEDQLSAYTGDNAIGYLQPLADAFGADLNDGWYYSGKVPAAGPHFKLELRYMSVRFGDEDRVFNATTEGAFTPAQTVEAPTIVGGESVEVQGDNGTAYAFPGGFNLDAFALAVPQIRVGSIMGTEAVIRYFAMDTGDVELGKISLIGLGVRHSISQYLPLFPVDLAAGFLWQSFTVGENDAGDDLLSTNTLSIGVQASKGFGMLEPYGGLSFDTFSMDVNYEDINTGEAISLDCGSDKSMHLTLGLAAKLYLLNLHGEVNVASQNSISIGAAVGL